VESVNSLITDLVQRQPRWLRVIGAVVYVAALRRRRPFGIRGFGRLKGRVVFVNNPAATLWNTMVTSSIRLHVGIYGAWLSETSGTAKEN